MTAVPAQAITAAAQAILDGIPRGLPRPAATAEAMAARALEAAEPYLAAAATDHVGQLVGRLDELEAIKAAAMTQAAADAARIAELEQLASELIGAFGKTSDGWRARAGQVQIDRWHKRLAGPHG